MKINKSLLQPSLWLTLLLTLWFSDLTGQEAVVFDETIDWAWSPRTELAYGGNGFYWWHRPNEGPGYVTNYGDMPVNDWKTPYNYENGTFYLRFEILEQPTTASFSVQLGIWQNIGTQTEVVSALANLPGGAGTSVEKSIGSPANWHQVYATDVDFTKPENFYRIGLILWKGAGSCIPMAQGWTNSSMCADSETEQLKYFPMRARVTLVAVASGHTFSGWSNYPGGGTTKPPTPTYGIDFTNEVTNKVVATTDEYANNAAMTGAVSGTGVKIALTPGQDVYFRTKAANGLPASNVQILDVPSRPAAPAFTYDATNQRTAENISNLYEYASTADMSGAVTGSGTKVSIPLGTTKYFRKKATASAFKSNVQALTGSSAPPTGSSEFVILNDIIEWPNTTDDNGFYFFYHNSNMPVNWRSPYDFYNGQIYTRFEIIEQATDEPVYFQVGIWQKLPPETGTLYETMGPLSLMSGPGSVVTKNNSPSTWWKLNGTDIDWTQMDKVWHFGINPWKNSSTQIRSENAAAWAERYTYWYPMKVRAIVVAVASGYTFSGWNNYLNAGGVPTYTIDYLNEQTTEVVSSSDEYSTNQTNWITGTNSKLTLTPGQDVYFRKKISPTQIQHLLVPSRAAAPDFSIDFINEKTSASVGSEYQYADNSAMTGAQNATGQPVTVVPGSTLYIRKRSTGTAFASAAQAIVAPARPAKPQIGVNYIAETTTTVSTELNYSTQSDMTGAVPGTGATLPVTPGTNLYFRKPATVSTFGSEIQQLDIPSRPAAPDVNIDFAYETTNMAITSDYMISGFENMSNSFSGTGAKLTLNPGTNLYIQKKASGSQFASEILELVVPERPVITVTLPNPVTTISVPVSVHFPGAVTGFDASDLRVTNGTVESMAGSYTATIKPTSVGSVLIALGYNVVNEGNFAAFTTSFNYQPVTGVEDFEGLNLKVYPTIATDYLNIEIPLDETGKMSYKIFDNSGILLENGALSESVTKISLTRFSKGLYLLILNIPDGKSELYKFIKE